MRKVYSVVLTMAVVALAASPALAQRQGRGAGMQGNPVFLLMQKSVQEELKLTDEQKTKATELQTKAISSFQELQGLSGEERTAKVQEIMKENEKAIAGFLKPEQSKRLKQISLQQQGSAAFANEDVAKTLSLTAEQKEKLKAIQDDSQQAAREIFQDAQGDREGAMKKLGELRKTTTEKAIGVLTAEQKTKWKDLTGPEFKGEITFRRPGGA